MEATTKTPLQDHGSSQASGDPKTGASTDDAQGAGSDEELLQEELLVEEVSIDGMCGVY